MPKNQSSILFVPVFRQQGVRKEMSSTLADHASALVYVCETNVMELEQTHVAPYDHRLNMELDLQSLFGFHVYSCTHWLRPRNSPPPPAFGPI